MTWIRLTSFPTDKIQTTRNLQPTNHKPSWWSCFQAFWKSSPRNLGKMHIPIIWLIFLDSWILLPTTNNQKHLWSPVQPRQGLLKLPGIGPKMVPENRWMFFPGFTGGWMWCCGGGVAGENGEEIKKGLRWWQERRFLCFQKYGKTPKSSICS